MPLIGCLPWACLDVAEHVKHKHEITISTLLEAAYLDAYAFNWLPTLGLQIGAVNFLKSDRRERQSLAHASSCVTSLMKESSHMARAANICLKSPRFNSGQ